MSLGPYLSSAMHPTMSTASKNFIAIKFHRIQPQKRSSHQQKTPQLWRVHKRRNMLKHYGEQKAPKVHRSSLQKVEPIIGSDTAVSHD